MCTLRLEACHRVHKLTNSAGGFLQRVPFLVGEFDLDDFFHAAGSDFDRHSDVDVLDPELTGQERAAREDSVLVEQHRLHHLDG